MDHSRRNFLTAAAATVGTMPLLGVSAPMAEKNVPSQQEIMGLFQHLPGTVAVKILAPSVSGSPSFLVESNAAKTMFVGSAIKTFILCEVLRKHDSPDVSQQLAGRMLTLDADVWSPGSPITNPPNLIGQISLRTALEAMIMHSDNTATDMALKYVGPESVRQFISMAELKSARIPHSTRSFFGYLVGAKDYKTFSWQDFWAASNQPTVNPPLNDVETLACSADDFVSYYRHALNPPTQDASSHHSSPPYFKHAETLHEFQRILSLGDAIWALPLPLGIGAFVKGGSLDIPGFHALCATGAMLFNNRWVYFCITINWAAPAQNDPDTVKAFLNAASTALAQVHASLSA